MLVVSSNLMSTMKTLFKEKQISSCQEADKSLPGSPEIVKNFGLGTYGPVRTPKSPLFRRGGECYYTKVLGLCRCLVNLLPGAQRTNASTLEAHTTVPFHQTTHKPETHHDRALVHTKSPPNKSQQHQRPPLTITRSHQTTQEKRRPLP